DGGAGTFPMGTGQVTSAGLTMDNKAWTAGGTAGGGTVVVNTSNESRLAGTFNFGLVATGGQTPAQVAISQGVFDIELRAGVVGSTPAMADLGTPGGGHLVCGPLKRSRPAGHQPRGRWQAYQSP